MTVQVIQMAAGDTNVDTGSEFKIHYMFMGMMLRYSRLFLCLRLGAGGLNGGFWEFATSVNVGSAPIDLVRDCLARDPARGWIVLSDGWYKICHSFRALV